MISVVHFPEFAGPHNQLLRLTAPLREHGVETLAVLPEGPGAERLRAGGVPVHIMALGRVRRAKNPLVQLQTIARFPIDLFLLLRLFRRERPDIVVLSGLMNPHAAIAAKLLGIPVMWQILDTLPPMAVRKVMMRVIRVLADSIMPIGEAVAKAHPGTEAFGDRMVIFYPPVDTETFRPDPTSDRPLRKELGIDADAPVVGVIGNINPMKGHEYFVEAAAMVHAELPEARFVLAGHIYPHHQQYFEGLLAQAERLGLIPGKHIFFLGSRSDIPDILHSIDVLALASLPNSEGTPTVILEAMACGVPVVATDVASVSEVVVDGETGYVVPSMDAEAMARRLTELASSDALRSSVGDDGHSRIEASFSLEACVEAHLEAFGAAASGGPIRVAAGS